MYDLLIIGSDPAGFPPHLTQKARNTGFPWFGLQGAKLKIAKKPARHELPGAFPAVTGPENGAMLPCAR